MVGLFEMGAENHPELPERSQILVRTVYADAMDVRSAALMEMVEDTADAAGIRSLENEAFSERWIAASRLNKIRWGDLRDRERDEAFDLLQNRLDDNPQPIDLHRFAGIRVTPRRRHIGQRPKLHQGIRSDTAKLVRPKFFGRGARPRNGTGVSQFRSGSGGR